jgi:prepilin-type N-terminal cleavage/methylation domain-containing protein
VDYLRRSSLGRRLPSSRCEAGYTMLELLVVMVITSVVLIGLTASFAAALSAETGSIRRAQAQANARVALGRMRTDIHCASAVQAPQENPYGGFTLTLTQTPNVCPVVTTSSSGVQWCTIPYPGSTTRWQLFRFLGTVLADCDGSASATLLVDYIAAPTEGWPANTASDPVPTDWDGNLWPTAPACPTGYLPTTAIDMTINLDPVAHQNEGYDLEDTIALRNAPRCP